MMTEQIAAMMESAKESNRRASAKWEVGGRAGGGSPYITASKLPPGAMTLMIDKITAKIKNKKGRSFTLGDLETWTGLQPSDIKAAVAAMCGNQISCTGKSGEIVIYKVSEDV